MGNDNIRVLIITVNEFYYVPRFLKGVLESDSIDVVGITALPPTLGTRNIFSFAYELFQSFGARIFMKHTLFYLKYLSIDTLNRHLNRGEAYSPKTLAKRHGVDYRYVTDVNSSEYLGYVEEIEPDIIASVAATQKFEKELIEAPQDAAINIHSSLLPKYRGVSPNFWALLNDEDYTGITVHYMDDEIDTGDIISQERLPIKKGDSLHSLNKRVAEKGSDVLLESIEKIRSGKVEAREIDPEEGEYYTTPRREDVREFLQTGGEFY